MPRLRLFSAVILLSTAPAALLADTIEAASRVTRVTLYPWGASVVREVMLATPAGVHTLIVPDLPQDTDTGTLRVVGAGLSIGAVNLMRDRIPVTDDTPSPDIARARAEVERLEQVLRERDVAIAAIRLRASAAAEQIAFLRGLNQTDAPASAEDLRAIARMVGEEVLAASQTAQAAESAALTAELARKADAEALDKARQALAALIDTDEGHAALSVSVAGSGTMEITTYTPNASWQPVYDLRLARAEGRLNIARGVIVSQYSGEDWIGVDLTLSTARPAERSEPSTLWPWLRRIGEPEAAPPMAPAPMAKYGGGADMMVAEAAPVVEQAEMQMMGATVTYRYGAAVDIRDGVEDLRLVLDDLVLSPKVLAEAVPARDASAFLVAEAVNDSGQVLLPGPATLFVDGAMIGLASMPLTAAGDDLRMGFGPIDGLRLTRSVPERTEGDRGVISKSNEQREVAVLTIDNLTNEDWPLRVIDQVPYSEQEDLVIRYTATPAPSVTDLQGQRGILAWEAELAAGKSKEIRLETSLSWPDGLVLQ